MTEYPNNSRKAKEEREEAPKVEKIIEGSVIRRKKPLGKRFLETFVGGSDAGSVWAYVIQDVAVPAAKDMFSDVVTSAVERMLFGDSRGGRSRSHRPPSRGGSPYTSYNRISTSSRLGVRDDPRPELSRQARTNHDFGEIIIPTRVEADEVIDKLYEMIQEYEVATLENLYDAIGEKSHYTDRAWGWTDLREARPIRVKGGYLLHLPKPEPIN